MAEIIDLPQETGGTPEEQIRQMYSYLYRLARDLNLNFQQIGSGALTDDEAELMKELNVQEETPAPEQPAFNYADAETLKSLIIKTAQFVKTAIDTFRITLFGEESAEGQQGNWVRKKGVRVDVTPDGTKQTFSFAETIKGLKTYEINAKNYIKTGYLRTENSLPVYGVQVGKDIVTFAEDGTETYHDGNKVAEFTADGISFYANGTILAKYTGTKISFYIAGVEVMYIQAGKIYSTMDLELGSDKSVTIGQWLFDRSGLILNLSSSEQFLIGKRVTGATYTNVKESVEVSSEGIVVKTPISQFLMGQTIVPGHSSTGEVHAATPNTLSPALLPMGSNSYLGDAQYKWLYGFFWWIYCNSLTYTGGLYNASSREIKHDIQDMPEMGETLDRLNPVTFIYDEDPDENKRFGLIYEDAIEIIPEICTQDEGNKAIDYLKLVPVLLKEIQSLRARVSELERRN